MLKEHEPPKEKASERAARRWKNAELRKRVKQTQQRPQLVDPDREPEIAEVLTTERPKGSIKSFESRFAKEIRAMMEGHVNKNIAIQIAFLEYRKRKLLKEKLRRLKLAQEASQ